MADNPNKTSAKPNFHGGGASRRGGGPSHPRLMDFVDSDFRRYRNHNFQPARSNGRSRSDRPQTSSNNRSRFEKPPNSGGNRNRSERPPSTRNYPDRSSNGNYSGRLFNANGTNHDHRELGNGDSNRSGLISESQSIFERHRNEENDVGALHKGNAYVGDINCADQETTSSTKCHDTSDHSSHLGNNVNGEASNDSYYIPSLFHRFSPDPVEMRSTHNHLYSSKRGDGSDLLTSDQRYRIRGPATADEPNVRVPRSSYMASLPGYSNLPVFNNVATSPDFFGLPDGRRPICDNFEISLNAVNQNTIPYNLPRPIKGRFSPAPNPTVGLPCPKKQGSEGATNSEAKTNLPHTVTSGALHEEWANAPEFFPKASKPKSYAEVLNPQLGEANGAEKRMCPYAERTGECRMPAGCCPYLHGDICELCGCAALHPTDTNQRNEHHQKCVARHEKEMELSFAVARSKDKTCGICFEVVLEKQVHERRFGILTQCNHCFCLVCIRKWRQARQFENKVVRACPECRVTSDFVCPSVYWVETKEEKDKLIENYKNALAEKQCKYFKQGRGSCPFGNKCFYLHAFPDGTKTDVGPPPRRRRQNRARYADEGELGDMLQQIILWDFLDEHDHHWLYSFADDIEELVAFFSDSDESEWSDYEFLLD